VSKALKKALTVPDSVKKYVFDMLKNEYHTSVQ
jgi:hypothetical protein